MIRFGKHNPPRKYYVYYHKKTGRIHTVTNEMKPEHEYGLELPFDKVEKLLTGEWSFKDYYVGYQRIGDSDVELAIIPIVDEEYTFRNSVFEWLSENADPEVEVTWNGKEKNWKFSLSEKFKEKYDESILAPRLLFFVTLESDFDFLIRTIQISMEELINTSTVVIPFESNFEKHIRNIAVGTKLVFKSYGLKVYE